MEKIKEKAKKIGLYTLLIIITLPALLIYIPLKWLINIKWIKIPLKWLVNIIWFKILRRKKKLDINLNNSDFRIIKYLNKFWLGNSNTAQNNRVFFYFLFPAVGAFILMVIIPFSMGVYYSLTDWNGLNNDNLDFVGLDNYKDLFKDVGFFYSFYKTALYSILNIIVINIVAFSLALLVTQKLKLKNLYRAGFFMPNLIGGLVLGYIFQFIFNKAFVEFGGIFEKSFLIEGNTALMAIIIVVTWQYAGYIMMIYIAALQNIPQDLIEASKIDGANAFQRLKTITLPLVSQAFTVALFLTLVTSFKQYDTVMSLSGGGPATLLPTWIRQLYSLNISPAVQSLDFIAIDIYDEAFTNNNMALGQAKAIVFFLFLLVVSLVQVNYNKKREVEL